MLVLTLCVLVKISTASQPVIFSKKDDLLALKQLAKDVNNLSSTNYKNICDLIQVGVGYGAHQLCNLKVPKRGCYFLSFGVEQDYSFDKALHELHNCSGMALDPTVDHSVKLTPGVIFSKAGANSLHISQWTSWSVPELRKWFGTPLYALKMDCEGCEYALARDIQKDDPDFFEHVLQLNIEFHAPVNFQTSDEHVYAMGRLMRLLKLAGLTLVHVDDGKCGPSDQDKGCRQLYLDSGLTCEFGCRSYLFSRLNH